MDTRVQCPVCTLYLHSGMSLESHLDTHPKDQVIKALCSLSAKSTGFGSRTPTPHSERSFRSRSRTPATDDGRWAGSHRTSENDRYWRRTPSRNKSTPLSSRTGTPDTRVGNIVFESDNIINTNSNQCSDVFTVKSDKTQRTYVSTGQLSGSDYDQRFPFFPEAQEDTEIKYSRSSEYNAQNESLNTEFAYNMPSPANKQANIPPTTSRRTNERDFVKILPKANNVFMKTNVASGLQYVTPGPNQMHVMMPTPSQFVQKNVQNNMILTGNLTSAQIHNSKLMAPPLTNQLLTSGTFTPGTTVVTQNSQIIYREMVHNLDGKPFMSTIPAVLGSVENVTNVSQSSALYQNHLMVVDQFGNTSCMYTTPQHLITKPAIFSENMTYLQSIVEKPPSKNNDKTLLIEVSPIPDSPVAGSSSQPVSKSNSVHKKHEKHEKLEQKRSVSRNSTPGPNKGLKIISNIKVEVPVKHHKNMLNTIMDLTGSGDYTARPISPEKILPDLDDNNQSLCDDSTQPSLASVDSIASNTFCAINNSSNASGKESTKSETKIDSEFSDSCPVPDLICNEKPSISPCSELSEHGDNSTDHIITALKTEPNHTYGRRMINNTDIENKQRKPKPLRINNAFVKKTKKVLQIKNSKFPCTNAKDTSQLEKEPVASSSRARSPEDFEINKIHRQETSITNSSGITKPGTLLTVSIEKIKENDEGENNEFDANTEEQSMDIEPVTPSNVNHSQQYTASVDIVQVKEEINTSNDFSNEADKPGFDLAPMATLRPINVISCSIEEDFDDDSSHRELLELEATSKNKQFVSMMNENYFGDNIYADYFTPDRVEAFEAEKESQFTKENNRENMYIWGEPSQRESEFVLPNFIHESYKIAENGLDYSDMGAEENIDGDKCEGDSKVDVLSESRSESEAPLNICADEKMPPRGELSGQESNGDMESPWSGMYSGVPPAEPYDLMARETWVSDGSEIDTTEKTEPIEEEIHFPKTRMYNCVPCGNKFPSLKELRSHKALMHASPTCSTTKTTYSRLLTARAIKKEEKPDPNVLQGES
ncbi:jg18941 [Pararge aegeria aegeria]|uniref:Jg18941 protein n=1 Tax=Pararge aegeria aegeria TaxID=348720 RepID=A0A8S4SJZ4_9NEOP|nr:jg18941 [Pararge aegeria aegeria]